MKIKYVQAREILDSRGIPTISTIVQLDDNSTAKGEVPSGASTGKTEVLELRDNDIRRHRGKGVLTAVDNINNLIAPQLIGKNFDSQEDFDKYLIYMDGTEFKTNFGGNTILSLSMAFCRATAISKGIPLYEHFAQIYWGKKFDQKNLKMPEPLILVMEGGQHGNWATDIQEYMIVPRRERFETFERALQAGAEIFHTIHDLLVERKYSAAVGFEGAFSPMQVQSNLEAFEIILEGIEKAGYRPDKEIYLAIDVAASEFYDPTTRKYNLRRENKTVNTTEWIQLQKEWYSKYPIHLVEDPMDQEDWEGWKRIMQEMGNEKEIVGDDLLTTNVNRIEKAIGTKAVNSVLIKLNQIGSITETISAIKVSKKAGFPTVISHRSGETNDDMIADFVVGTASGKSKFGAPHRGERLAKYNRLLEIERFLKS